MNRPRPSLNGKSRSNGAEGRVPVVLGEMLRSGLSLLWRSYEYTCELDPGGWHFAVDSDVLYQAGLSDIDLRWLIAHRYLEIAPRSNLSERKDRWPDDTWSCETGNSCFVLTQTGAAFALDVISRPLPADSHAPSMIMHPGQLADLPIVPSVEGRPQRQKPQWDRDRKELRCGECVVKRFRWAAVNQETILMAFEEEAWPARIDDPLPQKPDQDPKNRLHDTIKCLNRNHKQRLIRFNGDGTGEGVLWTFLDREDPDP